MPTYKKPDNETFIKVINAKYGNMVQVANALGVNRVSVWKWAKEDPEIEQAFKDAREQTVDLLESQFILKIRGIPKIEKNPKTGKEEIVGWEVPPDSYLIKYGLSTLGRERGWTERKEVDVTTKGESLNVPFRVVFTDQEEENEDKEDTTE